MLFDATHPAGVQLPLPPGRKGGGFEAFVAEMAAFATVAGRAAGWEAVALPEPSMSVGEVAVARALYRSAASGRFESVEALVMGQGSAL